MGKSGEGAVWGSAAVVVEAEVGVGDVAMGAKDSGFAVGLGSDCTADLVSAAGSGSGFSSDSGLVAGVGVRAAVAWAAGGWEVSAVWGGLVARGTEGSAVGAVAEGLAAPAGEGLVARRVEGWAAQVWVVWAAGTAENRVEGVCERRRAVAAEDSGDWERWEAGVGICE